MVLEIGIELVLAGNSLGYLTDSLEHKPTFFMFDSSRPSASMHFHRDNMVISQSLVSNGIEKQIRCLANWALYQRAVWAVVKRGSVVALSMGH